MSFFMSDMCATPGLLSFNEALTTILANVKPITETLTLPIEQALGYVLATSVVSPVNVPPHDNSAMDGYAFALQSLHETSRLTLAGHSMAGAPYEGLCRPGQCIRIMTGAKIPAGCDTVEMQENTRIDDENVDFLANKSLGANVRKAGEDINMGDTVLIAGKTLNAVDIGILASLGIARIVVYRKLKVALIATGDELKSPHQQLLEGDIYESNRFVLAGMLAKSNVEIIDFGIIDDDITLLKKTFVQADAQADVVISSGGVSVGEADYTKTVLEQLGTVGFWKIAMKPGKPLAFGALKNSVFFGLPGNPVSALITFHQLALVAIVKMQNASALKRTQLMAKTVSTLKKSPGRQDFQRGIFSVNEAGENIVTSTGAQGSGILSSLLGANCFIILASEQGQVNVGDLVKIELFDQYL
jgi:molybdopterin molybdotransferase